MKKRYTRDQEIDLMVNAPVRLEACMAKWLQSPQVKSAVKRSKTANNCFVSERKLKRVRCA